MPPTNEPGRGSPWTKVEVDLIVAAYFQMMQEELLGRSYSKKDHRKALSPLLQDRSNGSIEFKHQNISAVLVGLGLPYIEGYKPRGNYQTILVQAVEEFLAAHHGFFEGLADSPHLNPTAIPPFGTFELDLILEPPPERIIGPEEAVEPWITRKGRKIDFARRDAENRSLGWLGEQFALEFERRRLLGHGRDDLAARIEWVSQTVGDGLGFDLLTFDEVNDSERFVEVKTTALGKFFPFYVTATEVRCSEAVPSKYQLYRVFDFSRSPRLFVLPGAITEACQLEPVQYRATI